MKRALVMWSSKDKSWVIRVEEEYGWSFYEKYSVKDEVDGIGWVKDEILCELANLQDRGYQIIINI